MQYREFIKKVQANSGFSDSECEQATQVFMETLSSRLTSQELKDLCSQLPQEMVDMCEPAAGEMVKMSGEEFLERIAQRQNIDSARAKKQMHAVWLTLKEAVSEGEIRDIQSQLPEDLREMLH
ncbi:DUF2267 domain-containing protein [Candidatus Parcubacteria bacterium]|nr:DUF2267 domain-containing protein [Candidatus Parcubacteria bacterium]